MMYTSTRMWQYMRSLLVLTAALALPGAAVSYAQSAPPVLPDHTVFGRLGTGTGSGPGQAIPFTTLSTQLGISNTLAVGTTPVVGGVSGQYLNINGAVLGAATLGTMSLQSAGAVAITGGTITGVPNLLPTATTAGTVAYWNGAAWVIFAGNTSGTNCLGENASGVPAWTACSSSGGTIGVPNGGTGQTTFTANLPILGNGSSALIQGTRTGNTTKYATSTGALVNGDCVSIDGSGNLVDAGGACTTGGGGGTVSAGTATQLAYYATSGTTVSGNGSVTWTSPTLSVNVASSAITATNGTSSAKMVSDIGSNQPAMDWINGTVTWQMLENTSNTIGLTNGTGAGALAITTAGTYFVNGSAGTAGQCLQSAGSSSPTVWAGCGGGGGAVSSVSSGAGSLVISPTTGAVVADINPSFANTFLANQTISLNNGGLVLNAPTTGQGAELFFSDASAVKWQFGKGGNGPNNYFLYDFTGARYDIDVAPSGNMKLMTGGGNIVTGGTNAGGNLFVGGGSPWVDVRSGANGCLAAVGDGSTNDYAAISCQIAYMTSTYAGGVVFFPCGNYVIGTTLTITVPIILQGAGQACSLINTNGVDLMAVRFSSSVGQQLHGGIRELSIVGYQNSAAGQYLVEVDNFVELTFQNFTLNGGFFALFICGTGSGGGYATCSTAPHSGLHDLGADNTFMNGRIEGWGTLGGAIESYNGANWFYDIKADNDGQTNKYAIYFHTDNVLVAAGQTAESDFFRIDLSGTYTGGSLGLNDATGTASIIVMNHGIFGGSGGFGSLGTFRALSLIGSELGQGSVGITSGNLMVTGSMAGNGNAGATISFSGGSTRACAGNFGVTC